MDLAGVFKFRIEGTKAFLTLDLDNDNIASLELTGEFKGVEAIDEMLGKFKEIFIKS